MTILKQKGPDDEPKKDKKDGVPPDDPKLKESAKKGKELLDKLEQATKKKGGHYEMCCGVRVWVPY